ncbi:uncharacterized protein E0L32_007661 [Thyridium curvatum]|uniref:Double-strand break repair protein n=1 Tax=Thyridium curvatum TaxID=1093900 RepID=A0A507AP53_9PEZI|nr:uncharacterized protein E0L32_007661 [Thyridium curvatum]TPX11682.1 hypothetical protein E0L32_007661 [Thyridium curvatum]
MASNIDPDTIRILIATDNHVGYEERDPIRKDDSWKTFDEVISLAKKQDVDMVLLAGDLFHDNKPSRKSMYQVMRTLRKNCLGMKPCELEFLSDANEVFEGAFGHVNYEDPDINISIPVFSIHGNHDDPSGEGHFCSLDLLQVAGLVNYFGRIPEADNIKVKPVMLQKGSTKIALFGLSNVRDERMFRTFRDHKVTWYRPNQQQSDFFNILAVHQNHHAHTATGYLPENMLPDFLNLVVWGHEHECLIDPVQNPETGFHVMQPGSSVATSLIPGEAVTKHVAILSVTGKEFQVEKIPLKTVRPFVTQEIVLQTDKRFKDLVKKKDNRHELTKRLMHVVEEMIEQANADWLAVQEEADDSEEQPLPLIRLKVEYTAPEGSSFDVENPQRFSNRFVGKVANTNDVVYFYRKKTGTTKRGKDDTTVPEMQETEADLETIKVEALVQEYLAAQSLKILPQGEFGDAVNQFVNKDDKHAMETFVSGSLADQLKDLLALNSEEPLDNQFQWWREAQEKKFLAGQARKVRRQRYKPKPDDWDSDMEGHWENNPEALLLDGEQDSMPKQPSRQRTRVVHVPGVGDDDEEMDDVLMDDAPEPAPKTTAKRAGAARTTKTAAATKKAAPAKKPPARSTRGRKKGPFEDDSDNSDEEDMFVDEDEEPSAPPPPKTAAKRSQPARSSARTSAKQTTLNFSQPQRPATQRKGATQKKVLEISDDEISEDEDDAFETMPATRSRRR